MKYILIILFSVILGALIFGFSVQDNEAYNAEVIIGLSVLALSFIFMPLFIYYRWKNKNLKDYMLTKENLDNMRKREQ